MEYKSLDEYITNQYHILMQISKTICHNHNLYQDLLNFVLLDLLEQDAIILRSNDESQFRYYITGVLTRNWNSKTSRFWYQDKKHSSNLTELLPNVELIDDEEESKEKEEHISNVESAYSNLALYNRALLDCYLVQGSLKRVSKQTGIPLTSVSRGINFAKEQIKEEVKKGK